MSNLLTPQAPALPPVPAGSSRAAIYAARMLLAMLAMVVLGQLAACGGGGDDAAQPPCDVPVIKLPDGRQVLAPHNCLPDNPPVPVPAVDCTAHPELCK